MIGKLIRMGVVTWLAGYVTRKVASRMSGTTPVGANSTAPRTTPSAPTTRTY